MKTLVLSVLLLCTGLVPVRAANSVAKVGPAPVQLCLLLAAPQAAFLRDKLPIRTAETLRSLQELDFQILADRQLVGALTATLPPNFSQRLEALVATPEPNPVEAAGLAQQLSGSFEQGMAQFHGQIRDSAQKISDRAPTMAQALLAHLDASQEALSVEAAQSTLKPSGLVSPSSQLPRGVPWGIETRWQIKNRQYPQDRDLVRYMKLFGERLGLKLGQALLGLNPSQHWLDAGSGQGGALRTYFASIDPDRLAQIGGKLISFHDERPIFDIVTSIAKKPLASKARATGITYSRKPGKMDSWSVEEEQPFSLRDGLAQTDAAGKLRILSGRFFDDISDGEIGKADLITDVFGIFSYAANPMQVLTRYLDLLRVGGAVYCHFGETVYVADKGAPDFRSMNRSWNLCSWALLFHQWLESQSFPGLAVETYPGSAAFILTKLSHNVRLPMLRVGATRKGIPIAKLLIPPSST